MIKSETAQKNADIVKICIAHGFKVRRMNSGKVWAGKRCINLGEAGWSDIFGFHRLTGQIIAVETKKEGERITPEQKEFLDMVEKAGGIALIAYDAESVERVLRERI